MQYAEWKISSIGNPSYYSTTRRSLFVRAQGVREICGNFRGSYTGSWAPSRISKTMQGRLPMQTGLEVLGAHRRRKTSHWGATVCATKQSDLVAGVPSCWKVQMADPRKTGGRVFEPVPSLIGLHNHFVHDSPKLVDLIGVDAAALVEKSGYPETILGG